MKKRWIRIFLIILLIIILLPLSGYLALRTDWGRAYAVDKVTELLSDQLGLEVSIADVDFEPIEKIALREVLLLDHHQDTLLYAQELKADIALFQLNEKVFEIEELHLEEGLFRITRYEGEESDNIKLLIDRLKPKDESSEKWAFGIEQVELSDFRFERHDMNKPAPSPRNFDGSHIEIKDLSASLTEIEILEDGVRARTEDLECFERSGLRVKGLDSQFMVTEDRVEIYDMDLETEHSRLFGNLKVDYASGTKEDLLLDADLSDSQLRLTELGHFIPAYRDMDALVRLDAQVMGVLDDLLIQDAEIAFGRLSKMSINGRVKSLTRIDSLWLSAYVQDFHSEFIDLRELPVPGIREQIEKLPVIAERIGRFQFDGQFHGYVHDFDVDGKLKTDIGEAETSVHIVIGGEEEENTYSGHLDLKDLDLGVLAANEDLGTASTSLDLRVKGKGSSYGAEVKGRVGHLRFRGYDYENILVDGNLEEGLFNGFLSIRQPETDLDFSGLVDMRTSVPKFDFKAVLYQADLQKMGILEVGDSTSFTGSFIAEFEGDDVDEFDGRFVTKGLSYCKGEKEYYFEDLSVLAFSNEQERTVELRSSAVDASLKGRFRFQDLKRDFIELFREVAPKLYADIPVQEGMHSAFEYLLEVKESSVLTDLFLPALNIAPGTRAYGRLDSDTENFSLNLESDRLDYEVIRLNGVELELQRVVDIAYLSMTTEDMRWGDSLRFIDNFYTFNAYRDSLETDFTWALADKNASGSISALSVFHSLDSVFTQVFPSQMVMSGDYWLTEGMSEFLYHDGEVDIAPSVLTNGNERVALNGRISSSPNSRLEFDVKDFELEHLNQFLPNDIVHVSGVTNLMGYATAILGKPTVVADMLINGLSFENQRIGDVDLHSTWNKGEEFIELLGSLNNKGLREIYVEGRYYPVRKGKNLDAVLKFDQFDLAILNRIPSKGVSGLSGKASGELSLTGSPIEPVIIGDLSFDRATVKVNYLNTAYSFSDKVVVRENYIGTNYIPFTDSNGNQGFLNGTVAHENYKDWNYDVYAEFENMMVLNTTESMNERFYGKVFGTGSVSLSGYDQNLTIEVYGSTDKGTVLELPLGSRSDVVLEDFVYFKRTAEEDSLLNAKDETTKGIELYLEADVTPDAEIKLIFDEKIGDVMEGSGEGILTMTLSRNGEFEMYGNYSITKGEYLFTLQNVVNKQFTVDPGSTVSFYGDPYAAELDLKTIYKLRASLGDLLAEYGELYGNRVPVECQMDLDGPLLNPDIAFDIDFPGLDPGTSTLAQSKLNTEEELNRQVFSLLVLNKFLSTDAATVDDGIAGAANTGTEFASAQLSNWLSQISEDVDIGVNYRAGDNITSEELAVALTTQLFNDRLLLSGNFGVQSNTSSSVDRASSIIGDFRLEYIITKDGKLRLKVFNETNDNTVFNLNQSATKQGVGLIFQREFDGLFDDTTQN